MKPHNGLIQAVRLWRSDSRIESYLAILLVAVVATMFIARRHQSDGNGTEVMA